MSARERQSNSENPLQTILYSAGTDVGMRREENQDSYGIILREKFRLYIVADGMGGVQGGAVASNLAISTVEKILQGKAECSQIELVDAIQTGNDAIHARGREDEGLSGMGTTFVSLLFTPMALYIAHIGDSRGYLIREGAITQITEDHTLVQELVRSGAITEEQAQHHPVSHMLTRSMGPSPQVEIDCELLAGGPKPKDRYLLCSDGLYNLVKPSEILEIVNSNTTDDAVQMLIDLANERGGTDNITVLIVDTGDGYPSGVTAQKVDAPMTTHQDDSIQDEADDLIDEQDDYLIEDEESVEELTQQSSAAPSSSRSQKGGYHETGVVADSEIAEEDEYVEDIEEEIPEEFEDLPPEDIHEDFLPEEEAFTEQNRHFSRLPLIAAGFFGGIFVAYLLFVSGSQLPKTTTVAVRHQSNPVPLPTLPELVDVQKTTDTSEVEDTHVDEPHIDVPVQENPPILSTVYSTPPSLEPTKEIDVVLNRVEQASSERIGPAEKSSIMARKRDLEVLMVDLDQKVKSFDKPLSGELGEILKSSTKQAEEIRTKLDQLKSDIDLGTRKLALWFDRRRRLETTDAINMASEVAVSIPLVKQKKDEFEKATWDYLKEVEAMRYNPGNPERETHVAELVKMRASKMKELTTEVRSAIDKAVTDSDHAIADLTLQRGQLESSLEGIKGDIDFVRTITGNDEIKKNQLKSDVMRRREAAVAELEELKKLLPESSAR